MHCWLWIPSTRYTPDKIFQLPCYILQLIHLFVCYYFLTKNIGIDMRCKCLILNSKNQTLNDFFFRWELVSNEEEKRMERFIGGATSMPYHVSSKLVYCQTLLMKIATSPLWECLQNRKWFDKRSFYILHFDSSQK